MAEHSDRVVPHLHLCIAERKRFLRGTTCRDAPAELIVSDSQHRVGELVEVQIVGSDGEKLSTSLKNEWL